MTGDLLTKFQTCLLTRYTHVENDGSFAVKREGKELTIFFEGSNGLLDWLHNFNFPAKPYRRMDNLWFCHRGFLKVWKSIEPYIKQDICDLSVSTIDIVGYSHGGAIAQLCYEYVKFHRPDVFVTGVGFGSPRVLWGFACKKAKSRFVGFNIIRNGSDLVTHLPPVFLGFRNICQIVRVGNRSGLISDHRPNSYLTALTKEGETVEIKRYSIQAKRKNSNEKWSEWTSVDGYNDAVKHANRVEELGYSARIVDREESKDMFRRTE